MSLELQVLLWAVALTFMQVVVATVGAISQAGLPAMAGNREGLADFTGWVGRAKRGHRNMLESLAPFAILVLVAQAAGVHNAMTLMGAQLFIGARAAFAVIYLIGVPYLRTVAWGAAVVGMALIFLQLI